MAEKRMISISLIDDDRFLDMSAGAQLLYFHLSMRADDDGFFSSRKLMRTVNSKKVSLSELERKGYVILFESGAGCIVHWFANNTIKKDRYKESLYPEKKLVELVTIDGRKEYRLKAVSGMETGGGSGGQEPGNKADTGCIQNGNGMDTERKQNVSTDKTRTGKNLSVKKEMSCPKGQDIKKESSSLAQSVQSQAHPSLVDISEFIASNGLDVDAAEFYAACERDSWQIRGQPMRSWQRTLFAVSRNGTFSRDRPKRQERKAAGMARDLPEDLPAGVYDL